MAKRTMIPRPPGPNVAYGHRAPSRRKAATPAAAKSLRVQLTGVRTLEEAFAMIEQAFADMTEAGIPKLKNMYFYSTPVDAEGQPLIIRTSIPDIVIDKVPPYRSAAEHYKAP